MKTINERADDYIKGVAREVGKRAKAGGKAALDAADAAGKKVGQAVSNVASAGKEIIDTGRSESFDKDFDKAVREILNLIRQRENVVLEGMSEIVYQELLMEMDIDRELVAASVRYNMFLNEETEQVDEAWMDFIKGAAGKAKEKLSGATAGVRDKAKQAAKDAGDKVRKTWDKTKQVYREIDAAGKEASAQGDQRRTIEQEKKATEKKRAAVAAKQAEIDKKIQTVARRIAMVIQKREKQLGKAIPQHPTLTSKTKGVEMNSLERKKVLSAISAARRALRG